MKTSGHDVGGKASAPLQVARSQAKAHLKVREGGRIVSVAGIIAVAANTDGRR